MSWPWIPPASPREESKVREWSSEFRSFLLPPTYHWSLQAACPFSSSSSSPRWIEETQEIISENRWEEGIWVPWKEKAGRGAHRCLRPHPWLPECLWAPPLPPQSKCPLVVLQLEGHTLSKGEEKGSAGDEGKISFPTHLCPNSNPTQSIWFHKRKKRADEGRFREVWRDRVGGGPRAQRQMTVEMAMWTKKITPHPPPLFHTNLFKDKRSFYSIKNQKL